MSDVRRRRKSNRSCGSDDLSDSYDELNVTKETQSSEQTDGRQDSDCDSYESDFDRESQEGALRESGDGQEEEKPQKKLDDDEDRRNPQYIPKRGTFYEHDDRTTDEIADKEQETQNERETKEKKVWKDKEDKWNHDRYNDEEQAPKSHEELIAVYGYDIRNEEGPPRARRRRRYGRGPNKYTRNWEDENAYGKSSNASSAGRGNRRFNKNSEDFPALGSNKNASDHAEEPVISSAWYSNKTKSQNKLQNFPPLQLHDNQKPKSDSTVHTNENKSPNEGTNQAWKKDAKHAQYQSVVSCTGPNLNDTEKTIAGKASPKENSKKGGQEFPNAMTSRSRGRGFKGSANNNVPSSRINEMKHKGRGAGPIVIESKRNNSVQQDDEQQAAQDTTHGNANDGSQYHSSGRHNKNYYSQSTQQRSNAIPPRLQQQQSHHHQQQQQQQQQQQTPQQQNVQQQDGTANRPKRYSSLRQRPTVPENSTQQNYPVQHSQHNQLGQHGQHAQHAQHGQHGQHTQHGQHAQHSQHSQHSQHTQHGQHGYFPPQAGNARGVLETQGYAQGPYEQSQVGAVAAPAAPMTGQPVIPIPASGQPASYAPPPPFLVPPPQFIPPQTAPPSIINYVPGPNGPPFQPNFQSYQGFNPSVQPQGPPPPQELYQPQGCTYYSPAQQQQQQQQAAPLRRPKAAIPILPPPDNQQQQQQQQSGRGRGKGSLQNQQQTENNPADSNAQQIEQETKEPSAAIIENDSKTVAGQFDDAELEEAEEEPRRSQPEHSQATQSTETSATPPTTLPTATSTISTTPCKEEEETKVASDLEEIPLAVYASPNVEKVAGTDDVVGAIPEMLEEKIDISTKFEKIEKTSATDETGKRESTVVESSVVGEAAA